MGLAGDNTVDTGPAQVKGLGQGDHTVSNTKAQNPMLLWLDEKGQKRARELGIHRDTAKKYMEAVGPPMKRDRLG